MKNLYFKKIKNNLVRIAAIGSVAAVCGLSVQGVGTVLDNAYVYATEEALPTEISFFNDGYIVLNGAVKTAASGTAVVLTVIADQTAESPLTKDDGAVVYMEETVTDKYGNYSFEFDLPKSGKYRAFVGSSALMQNEIVDFSYVNKADFEAVIAVLCDDSKIDAEAAEVVQNNLAVLGLENVEVNDMEAVVKLVRAEAAADITPDSIEKAFKKSNMITELNAGRADDLKVYAEILEYEDFGGYLTEAVLSEMTSYLSKKGFKAFAEFDSAATDAVIISVVKRGTSDSVCNILKEYSSELGIKSSSVTSGMVKALANEDIDTISELKEFLADYKESIGSGSGSGSGSGGGGSSYGSGSNKYSGIAAEVNPSDNNEEQIYVFDDIANLDWAVEAITQLTYRGVINGKGNRVFAPNDKVTREEFAKILTLGFKLNLVDVDCPFEDVAEDDWSYPYIRSAYIAGIVNGVSETLFGYGSNITREDLCVMTDRMIKAGNFELAESGTEIKFADDEEISDYAKKSVYHLAAAGIVSGDGNGFKPKDSATRAEAAKIVYLALVKTNR